MTTTGGNAGTEPGLRPARARSITLCARRGQVPSAATRRRCVRRRGLGRSVGDRQTPSQGVGTGRGEQTRQPDGRRPQQGSQRQGRIVGIIRAPATRKSARLVHRVRLHRWRSFAKPMAAKERNDASCRRPNPRTRATSAERIAGETGSCPGSQGGCSPNEDARDGLMVSRGYESDDRSSRATVVRVVALTSATAGKRRLSSTQGRTVARSRSRRRIGLVERNSRAAREFEAANAFAIAI